MQNNRNVTGITGANNQRQECLFLANKRKTRQDNRHFDVQENNSEYVTGIQIIE